MLYLMRFYTKHQVKQKLLLLLESELLVKQMPFPLPYILCSCFFLPLLTAVADCCCTKTGGLVMRRRIN